MSYEITITKTEVQEVESGGDWKQVGEQPLTKDDLRQSIYDGAVVSEKGEVTLKKVYGYTPQIMRCETVTTEIYRQTVPEIDLPAVIKAVNKLD